MSDLTLIDKILQKFVQEELDLEQKYKELQEKTEHVFFMRKTRDVVEGPYKIPTHVDRETAFKRNKHFLKELEIESAKLRSRTYFCPTDLQLMSLKNKYIEKKLAHH